MDGSMDRHGGRYREMDGWMDMQMMRRIVGVQ